MSADNGWLLRKNDRNQFVVQEYFASADAYPDINEQGAKRFNSIEEALIWYEIESGYSEYGLRVLTNRVTHGVAKPRPVRKPKRSKRDGHLHLTILNLEEN